MSRNSTPSAVVRLDDAELKRWIGELTDDELALGLRSLVARASHLLVVLDLISFDEIHDRAEAGAGLEEVFEEVRRIVAPVREASDDLSQAFVTVSHIDVHDSDAQAQSEIEPGVFYERFSADHPETHGALRLRSAKALSASRRLIAREWKTLKARLEDENVRSSPNVLVTFCRAHLDRVHTLVECIAPALYAVLAPPGVKAASAELDAALAIRNHVVDFHKTVRDTHRLLESIDPAEWPPHLQRV
ncbi:MAG: hypothetical protein AAF658_06895, partial [Myxococcota bacterium]